MKKALDRDGLIFFKTLYKTQNLVNAAYQLGIPPATASRLLAKLRETFKDELFTRCAGGLAATWRVTELMPQVCRILDDYEHLLEENTFDPKSLVRNFHIGGVDHGVLFLAPAISRITTIAPGVSVEMSEITNDWPVELRTGELDAVISPMESVPEGCHYLPLLENCTNKFVCRPGHPLEKLAGEKGHLTMEDILRYGFVEVTWRPTNFFRLLKSREDAEYAKRRVVFRTPYFIGATRVVASSDLIMFVSALLADWCIKKRILNALPVAAMSSTEGRFTPKLIWHDRGHNDPAMQWLRGMILSAVRNPDFLAGE